MLSIIVAIDNNNLIGANNSLPWHLPADLTYFKQTTITKTVAMGRKTFESIGKALPNRNNIVISKNNKFSAADCKIINNINELISTDNDDEIFIIGGATIYKQTIDIVDRLYITEINYSFSGNHYFPHIDNHWSLIYEDAHKKNNLNPYDYTFKIFQR